LEIPQALSDFSFVLVYLVAAALFASGPLIIAKLIAPRSYGAARDAIYECGMPTIGSAWIQVAVIYYLFALLFLAFDVDGNLYVAGSTGGRRGIIRITPEREASVFLTGPNIVGLAFAPGGDMIVATTSALYRVHAGVIGRPLV